MKLASIKIKQFANVINQELKIDPKITVLIGRNQVGKTGLLREFLYNRYTVKAGYSGHSVPRLPTIPSAGERGLCWDTVWRTENEDDRSLLQQCLGVRGQTLVIKQDWIPTRADGADCVIEVDRSRIDCDLGRPEEPGINILNDGARKLLDSLPEMRYMSLSENSLLASAFEFRLTDAPDLQGPLTQDAFMRGRSDRLKTEEVLMKLAGLPAQCRNIPAQPKPWKHPVGNHPKHVVIKDIRQRFETLSAELTERLRNVWADPPNLTVKLKLCGDDNPATQGDDYCAEFRVSDAYGLEHFGTGLRWMLTFLIELWDIECAKDRSILLFDEPANHLHPSAQKQLVEYLNQVGRGRQIIYATHSPFLIDWRFPYRIRVLKNDWDGQGTRIDNRPYEQGCHESDAVIWDEVRGSVGVTFGDLGVLNKLNLLVEGVSDQVLISSLLAWLQEKGCPSLDLRNTSVIPFGAVPERLRLYLSMIKKEQQRAVVVVDSDEAGEEYAKEAETLQIPVIRVGKVLTTNGSVRRTLEDLMDIGTYVDAVNKHYGQLGSVTSWFSPISKDKLKVETAADDPLVEQLNRLFGQFGQDEKGRSYKINKTGVAISLAQSIEAGEIPMENVAGLKTLVEDAQRLLVPNAVSGAHDRSM